MAPKAAGEPLVPTKHAAPGVCPPGHEASVTCGGGVPEQPTAGTDADAMVGGSASGVGGGRFEM